MDCFPWLLFPAFFAVFINAQLQEQQQQQQEQFVVTDITIRPAIQAYLLRARANSLQPVQRTEDSIETWDTSQVTDMARLFEGASDFNADISSWDISAVTDVRRMFRGCSNFNVPIGSTWDTSSVTDMSDMFHSATIFNRPFSSNWNTARVTTMARMFESATLFRGDVTAFDTSRVTDLSSMFRDATLFNPLSLDNWDVSQVTDMSSMFEGATNFNSNIQSWNVTNVQHADRMFANAISFRNDLNGWKLSQLQSMAEMFVNAMQYSQTLCWKELDGTILFDAKNIFCNTNNAKFDPCCVLHLSDYLIQESYCCFSDGDNGNGNDMLRCSTPVCSGSEPPISTTGAPAPNAPEAAATSGTMGPTSESEQTYAPEIFQLDEEEQNQVETGTEESVAADGDNILTVMEMIEEEQEQEQEQAKERNKKADSGLIAVTASVIIIILLMLISFVAATWTMQQTSFAGMPMMD